ncbi:twin-arginine translocation signal domain-containing protein [Bradyrhizobium symbiodeficiens]|uniref:twin-arginine translocation signal domain-containing protein n=1 Tax=Bradyrhizobium symbiodeficiens TaxID=1404367 RepID=UPI0030D52A91
MAERRADTRDAPDDISSASRRSFLKSASIAAGTLAASVAAPGMVLSAPRRAAQSQPGKPVRVSKERLNELAAKFYAVFNERDILPKDFSEKHAARYDVELRRIVTSTHVPETGERVKVSALVAIPVGRSGALPVLSWQHGTILSFDQVPSNLLRLGDSLYGAVLSNASGLESSRPGGEP